MDRLQKAVERLGRHMSERARTRQQRSSTVAAPATPAATSTPTATTPGQLALLPPSEVTTQGLPQSLFGPMVGPRRVYLQHQLIWLPPGNDKGLYSGPQLGRDDRAVWLQLVAWADEHGHVDCSALSTLKALGWGRSRHDLLRLRACLERLQATALRVRIRSGAMTTHSLVLHCDWQPSRGGYSGRWQIQIDAKLAARFRLT